MVLPLAGRGLDTGDVADAAVCPREPAVSQPAPLGSWPATFSQAARLRWEAGGVGGWGSPQAVPAERGAGVWGTPPLQALARAERSLVLCGACTSDAAFRAPTFSSEEPGPPLGAAHSMESQTPRERTAAPSLPLAPCHRLSLTGGFLSPAVGPACLCFEKDGATEAWLLG